MKKEIKKTIENIKKFILENYPPQYIDWEDKDEKGNKVVSLLFTGIDLVVNERKNRYEVYLNNGRQKERKKIKEGKLTDFIKDLIIKEEFEYDKNIDEEEFVIQSLSKMLKKYKKDFRMKILNTDKVLSAFVKDENYKMYDISSKVGHIDFLRMYVIDDIIKGLRKERKVVMFHRTSDNKVKFYIIPTVIGLPISTMLNTLKFYFGEKGVLDGSDEIVGFEKNIEYTDELVRSVLLDKVLYENEYGDTKLENLAFLEQKLYSNIIGRDNIHLASIDLFEHTGDTEIFGKTTEEKINNKVPKFIVTNRFIDSLKFFTKYNVVPSKQLKYIIDVEVMCD